MGQLIRRLTDRVDIKINHLLTLFCSSVSIKRKEEIALMLLIDWSQLSHENMKIKLILNFLEGNKGCS